MISVSDFADPTGHLCEFAECYGVAGLRAGRVAGRRAVLRKAGSAPEGGQRGTRL